MSGNITKKTHFEIMQVENGWLLQVNKARLTGQNFQTFVFNDLPELVRKLREFV